MPSKKPTFQSEIKNARLKRNMTVKLVADRTGVSCMAIYHWENGRVRPRAENLTPLCKALGLPVRAMRELASA